MEDAGVGRARRGSPALLGRVAAFRGLPGPRLTLLPPLPLLLLCGPVLGELRAPPEKLAVIGAGIGGTSASYYLRQKFGKDVKIHVFERGKVGGRLATVNVEGQDYEAGGSVIHPLNLHMKRFVKELDLSTVQSVDGLMGIYNGEDLVFEESSWFIINMIKLVWHYGFQFLRMHMWIEDILDKFMRIYRYQSHDYSFSSVEGLLHALGGDEFTGMLNRTILQSLQKAGFSEKFLNEIVTPAMRVNYGQSTSINGFVGAVSLSGTDSGLWSVEGGNKRVCEELLQFSKALLISGSVMHIEEKARMTQTGGPKKAYEVTYKTDSGINKDLYDIVLVATPLNRKMSNITFLNFDPPIPEFHQYYHHLVTTFVHGRLNASFFGLMATDSLHLTDILTTDNPNLFINSISQVSPVKREADLQSKPATGSAVWKIFSSEFLTKEQLNLLFASHDSVQEKEWLAYPHYKPPEKCPPIILHDRIYYLNGIEWAASAMEMSAIAAHNAALLAYHRWYGNTEMIDQEGLYEKLKTEL
ncbi:prenylcysteine oxidase 1 isoform X1 [Sarcophilus harrisii]|uniref:Prenylcysteine oxidase 1 n=1 Tax=Sarcophilus harrisii TaxID=9305 RepID=A0A7N4P0D0_SARHA|nr:prenylcysteine oxidase 1 isoform X1 [Sarcophilus harrisii]